MREFAINCACDRNMCACRMCFSNLKELMCAAWRQQQLGVALTALFGAESQLVVHSHPPSLPSALCAHAPPVQCCRKTAITTRILSLVHELCLKQIHVTKRDLFYTDVKLFEVRWAANFRLSSNSPEACNAL